MSTNPGYIAAEARIFGEYALSPVVHTLALALAASAPAPARGGGRRRGLGGVPAWLRPLHRALGAAHEPAVGSAQPPVGRTRSRCGGCGRLQRSRAARMVQGDAD